jgi:predicted phosphodiesterase
MSASLCDVDLTDADIIQTVRRHRGQIQPAARALGIAPSTLRSRINNRPDVVAAIEAIRAEHGFGGTPTAAPLEPTGAQQDADEFHHRLHTLLKKRGGTVEEIADALDVAPRRVREGIEQLQHRGFRVGSPTGNDEQIVLHRVAPDKLNLHKSLLDGDHLRIGVVSDTHLGSNEEALGELHLAYDRFQEEGITEVYHAGDFVCGLGIFPTQGSEIHEHTFEDQVEYLVENYPKRDGIITRGISGNHDIEGQFGRIGADPVAAAAHRRDDIDYLGAYSAWVELPNGAWMHLLHGKGGMSYAYSYKAQKLVDGYPSGRKPAILCVGHWHVSGHIEARGVQVIWPGAFEWKSKFMERLGLSPSVGFQILDIALGEDGSLVQFTRNWFRFWEGRTVVSTPDAS